MKLIIGLGNPGPQYRYTRHNLGFQVLDVLARRLKIKFKLEPQLKAEIAESDDLILAKPTTFMNNSGQAALKLLRKYNLSVEDIMVIHDDLDMDFGKIRIKKDSASGGHNGIKSIIEHLGTKEFTRLKIGIGRARNQATDHVLGKFTPQEKETLPEIIDSAIKHLT